VHFSFYSSFYSFKQNNKKNIKKLSPDSLSILSSSSPDREKKMHKDNKKMHDKPLHFSCEFFLYLFTKQNIKVFHKNNAKKYAYKISSSTCSVSSFYPLHIVQKEMPKACITFAYSFHRFL